MGDEEDVTWQRDCHERKTVVIMRSILRRVVRVWVAVERDGGDEEVGELDLAGPDGMTGMLRKRADLMRWRREGRFARMIASDKLAVSRGGSEDGRQSLLSWVKCCQNEVLKT